MKACFFGMGSIGSRHARNLGSLMKLRGKQVEIHALRSSGEPTELADKVFSRWDDLEPPYDAVFITNPTSMHYDTLLKAEPLAGSFFVEKPVFSTSEIPGKTLESFCGKMTHVACPLRFHPVVLHLKKQMPRKVLAARLLCSSYLPEWRKGTDYRAVYSARRDLGGGVALDLIHELDYARWLFGDPMGVIRFAGKVSSLEIESDDIACYILTYRDKVAQVHLDYFGRKARRELELFCEEDTFVCDLLENSITALTSGESVGFPEEDIREREMEYFLDLLEVGGQSFNPLEYALDTLRIAEGGSVR